MEGSNRDPADGGERFVPGLSGRDLALEHWHRYALACQYAPYRRVADIACGVGYGSELLAQFAETVVGIDRDEATVTQARSRYLRSNLSFLCADATCLPLDASSIDLVVSCETIEHLASPDRLLSEIKRVLRPEGVLVASTPNIERYAQTRSGPNPYHVSEMRPSEFAGLLTNNFAFVHFLGQALVFGSSIRSLVPADPDRSGLLPVCSEGRSPGSRWLLSTDDLTVEQAPGCAEPVYLLAVASDAPVVNPNASLLEYKTLVNPAASLLGGLRERDQRISELKQQLADANVKLAVRQSDAQKAVELLSEIFLDRPPTDAERAHFTSMLTESGSLSEIVNVFAQSKEFRRSRQSGAKLFVPPGHFYSPVVSPTEVDDLIPKIRPQVEVPLPDVKLDIEAMTRFWKENLAGFARKSGFPSEPDSAFRYRFNNPAFSYADGLVLEAMILHFCPARIIEVGSGWSTACILDVLSGSDMAGTKLTCIEPHPTLLYELVRPEDTSRVQVLSHGVQSADISIFASLESGDILFIDSTHVLKTGSDVEFELSRILPILNEGVVIHFHDIFYPFEYGYQWVVEENRSWNEGYALRYFLAFNHDFEVIFFNDMFAQLRQDLLKEDCPKMLNNSGGSIWLRRSRRTTWSELWNLD